MSRELDEACALAMGWKREERINEGPLWRGPNAKLSRYCSPPAFSVGDVYVTELFDHLGKTGSVEVTRRMDGIYRARHRSTRQGDSDYMHGSALSEALAKLVVAVGDAKEKP